jgi:hypothetical protein
MMPIERSSDSVVTLADAVDDQRRQRQAEDDGEHEDVAAAIGHEQVPLQTTCPG